MTDSLRAEHDAVLSSLETRVSTLHFAHMAVSFFLSISLFGTAGKLAWDFWEIEPRWTILAAAAGACVLVYSIVRGVIGARAYRREKVQIDRLLNLRKAIGVDAPLALSAEKAS